MISVSSAVSRPASRPTCRLATTIRCPLLYGNLLRITNARTPRWMRSGSSSPLASASQKMQPVDGTLASVTYPSLQGVQRRLIGRPLAFGRLVDEVLQLFAGLEVRHLLRRHVHAVAGLRIPAFPRLALPQAEAPEAPQLDLFAAMERRHDAVADGIDDDLGMLLREVGHPGDFFDQLGFGHQFTSSLVQIPSSPALQFPGYFRFLK